MANHVQASLVVESVEDGIEFAEKIGYPVVLRPAYTLGGSGGGIAHDRRQLVEILENGLRLSRVGQVLVERCIAGWKEIEYEVMRDAGRKIVSRFVIWKILIRLVYIPETVLL